MKYCRGEVLRVVGNLILHRFTFFLCVCEASTGESVVVLRPVLETAAEVVVAVAVVVVLR